MEGVRAKSPNSFNYDGIVNKKYSKSKSKINLGKYKHLYLLFLPVALYYIVFRYWPIVLAWIVALKDFSIGMSVSDAVWVGLDNFKTAFSDPEIVNVLKNTVQISLLRLVVGFFPPIFLAIMFHDMASKYFKKVTQSIVYIPHFFSWVIVFGISYAFLAEGHGFINNILDFAGFKRIEFLLSLEWFRPIIILTALWKEVGWGTIIYIAALSTIDPQLYEAAVLDGAGPIRRIIHITFPGILPVVTFVLCTSLGSLFYAGGEQILLFYNPGVMDVADIIDTWIYRVGLSSFQYGLATAVGLFQAFFGMLLILVSNYFAKKFTGNGIW